MKSIFIIEDDANIREIEEFALKNSGYETEAFACAADFLRDCVKKTVSYLAGYYAAG